MTDAILSDNQRKAELSHAFIAALAARAGYLAHRGPQPDVDSIDATIRSGSPNRDAIDLQLKATATARKRCGWWLSLAGRDPLDAGSRTVVIPRHNRIGELGLAPLFAHVREAAS